MWAWKPPFGRSSKLFSLVLCDSPCRVRRGSSGRSWSAAHQLVDRASHRYSAPPWKTLLSPPLLEKWNIKMYSSMPIILLFHLQQHHLCRSESHLTCIKKKNYSPDFTDNSFSFTWQFFFCLQCLLLLDFTETLQQRTPLQTTQGLMALPRPLIVNHRPRKLNKRPCELNLQWEQNPQKL